MRKFALLAATVMAAALLIPVAAPTPVAAQGITLSIGSPRFGPPVARYERRPNRPYAGAVWISGNWSWNNGRYTWVSGRWDRPRAGYHNWQDGHWVQRGRNWVWVEGRWR